MTLTPEREAVNDPLGLLDWARYIEHCYAIGLIGNAASGDALRIAQKLRDAWAEIDRLRKDVAEYRAEMMLNGKRADRLERAIRDALGWYKRGDMHAGDTCLRAALDEGR